MPLPTQSSIELYLLHEIAEMGGAIDVRQQKAELLRRLERYFPAMSASERDALTSSGAPRFQNKVEWARNSLVNKGGFLDGSVRGRWGPITLQGREYLTRAWPSNEPPTYGRTIGRTILGTRAGARSTSPPTPSPALRNEAQNPVTPTGTQANSLAELVQQNQEHVRKALKDKLLALSPKGFEEIVGALLKSTGFTEVEVTGRTNDGGIDGFCTQPFLSLRVPFQAKRWANRSVDGDTLSAFRGRVVGKYAKGIFITTSTFTPAAKASAEEWSEIEPINGDKLVDFMLEKGLGVQEKPLTYLDIDGDFFAQFS